MMSAQAKWNKAHPEAMRGASKRHRTKNPLVVRRDRLKKYGLTLEEFDTLFERQGRKCLGCRRFLSDSNSKEDTAVCIDHDHVTGKVRGLLCRQCNWTLGNAHDDKGTLRNLMAYLEYDRSKKNVYVIGALKNQGIQDVSAQLRASGLEVFDSWQAAGPDADSYWQAYETKRGHSYVEALAGPAAQNIFHFDKAHLDMADAVVLVAPAGKSAHMELGYSIGQGKQSFVLMDGEPERYDQMYRLATGIVFSVEDLVEALNG